MLRHTFFSADKQLSVLHIEWYSSSSDAVSNEGLPLVLFSFQCDKDLGQRMAHKLQSKANM